MKLDELKAMLEMLKSLGVCKYKGADGVEITFAEDRGPSARPVQSYQVEAAKEQRQEASEATEDHVLDLPEEMSGLNPDYFKLFGVVSAP